MCEAHALIALAVCAAVLGFALGIPCGAVLAKRRGWQTRHRDRLRPPGDGVFRRDTCSSSPAVRVSHFTRQFKKAGQIEGKDWS